MQLVDQITSLAPQYRPNALDLEWFQAELEKVQRKALPKLIRRRFIEALKAAAKPIPPEKPVPNPALQTTSLAGQRGPHSLPQTPGGSGPNVAPVSVPARVPKGP